MSCPIEKTKGTPETWERKTVGPESWGAECDHCGRQVAVGATVIVYFNNYGNVNNFFCSDACTYERTCGDCGTKEGVEDQWETLEGAPLCSPCVDKRFREREHHPPEWE